MTVPLALPKSLPVEVESAKVTDQVAVISSPYCADVAVLGVLTEAMDEARPSLPLTVPYALNEYAASSVRPVIATE